MAFLSHVLAGFAITAAIELVSMGRKGRLEPIALRAFLIGRARWFGS